MTTTPNMWEDRTVSIKMKLVSLILGRGLGQRDSISPYFLELYSLFKRCCSFSNEMTKILLCMLIYASVIFTRVKSCRENTVNRSVNWFPFWFSAWTGTESPIFSKLFKCCNNYSASFLLLVSTSCLLLFHVLQQF